MAYYNELYHHGIKGMKWGVRRYQNSNGRKRYKTEAKSDTEVKKKRLKTAIKVGAAAAGTALAIYGGYKASQYMKTAAGAHAKSTADKLLDAWGDINSMEVTEGRRPTDAEYKRAANYGNAYRKYKKYQKEVSKSTVAAAKYLWKNRSH